MDTKKKIDIVPAGENDQLLIVWEECTELRKIHAWRIESYLVTNKDENPFWASGAYPVMFDDVIENPHCHVFVRELHVDGTWVYHDWAGSFNTIEGAEKHAREFLPKFPKK
jgi:hypothetical protein